jgi:hypothetical protein
VAAGRCRTRIVNQGVIPSLHVYYKNTHLKQYHKEGRGLRTETTINNTYDFGVGRLLKNLPQLREIGFAANRRVLEVEKISNEMHLNSCKGPWKSKASGPRLSALEMPACKRCLPLWSCSASNPKGSPINNCGKTKTAGRCCLDRLVRPSGSGNSQSVSSVKSVV